MYSAFRFVKKMHSLGKPIAVLNVGKTRVDEDDGMKGTVKNLWKREVGVSQFFEELRQNIGAPSV